jgi:hypothetical protein
MSIPTGTNLLSALPLATSVSGEGVNDGALSVLSTNPDFAAQGSKDKEFWAMLNQKLSEFVMQDEAQVAEINDLFLSIEVPVGDLEGNPEAVFSAGGQGGKLVPALGSEMLGELHLESELLVNADPETIPGGAQEWMQGMMSYSVSDHLKELSAGHDAQLPDTHSELPSTEYVIPAFGNRHANDGDSLPLQRQTAAVNLSRAHLPGEAGAGVAPLTLNADLEPVKLNASSVKANLHPMTGAQAGSEAELDVTADMDMDMDIDMNMNKQILKSENFKSIASELSLPVAKENMIPSQAGQFSGVSTLQSAPHLAQPQPLAAAPDLQLSARQTPAQWGEALGEKVSLLLNQQLNKAEIRIDPPHLGKLDIQIHVKDDVATVVIHTQHAQTRDMIDSASVRLREFLQEAGYSAVNVDVSQRDQSAGQHDLAGQQGSGEQDGSAQAFNQDRDVQDGQSSMVSMQVNDGRIDYFA